MWFCSPALLPPGRHGKTVLWVPVSLSTKGEAYPRFSKDALPAYIVNIYNCSHPCQGPYWYLRPRRMARPSPCQAQGNSRTFTWSKDRVLINDWLLAKTSVCKSYQPHFLLPGNWETACCIETSCWDELTLPPCLAVYKESFFTQMLWLSGCVSIRVHSQPEPSFSLCVSGLSSFPDHSSQVNP